MDKSFWASQTPQNDSFHYHDMCHTAQRRLESLAELHDETIFSPPS